MRKEYTNEDVYDFLTEECRQDEDLWSEFGEGIISQTKEAAFWNSLSEELDCFRICEECGMPMIEGYVVDGSNTYCSKECLYKHVSEEEYNTLYNDGEGDTYWTTWYEDSKAYMSKMI